jgi:hypothetical protein
MTAPLYAFEPYAQPDPGVGPPSDRARFEQMLNRHHGKLRRVVAGVVADPRRRPAGGVLQGVPQAAAQLCERRTRGHLALPRDLPVLPRRAAQPQAPPRERERGRPSLGRAGRGAGPLAGCTADALATAGVVAAPFGSRDVVDQTLTCSTQTRAGYHTFAIAASPTRPAAAAQYGRHTAAQVIFTTGADWFYGTKLLQLDATLKGSLVSSNLCASSGSKLALSPHGLPLRADYAKGSYSGRELQCLRPGKITFRSRVTFDAKGAPVQARIAVEMAKTHKPVLYADWSPKRSRLYGAAGCRDADF